MILLGRIETAAFSGRYYPLFLGFSYAQLGLVAIWFSFSAIRWWIRLPITILAAVGCMYLIMWGKNEPWGTGSEVFYGSSLALSIAVGILLRPFTGTVGPKTDRDKNRLAQITLLTIMGWTAAVAVAIAFLAARWKLYAQNESALSYFEMSMAAFSINVISGFFLFSRRPVVASSIALVLSWAIGMVTIFIIHDFSTLSDLEYVWHFGMIYFSQCVIMLITLAAARFAGYRPTYAVNIHEEIIESTT